jgi:flagellar biosynthetic protein FliR
VTFTEAQLIEAISAWFFTFVRVGAVLTAGPVFSASSVPARFRVLLALAITLLVEPLLPRAEPVDPLSTTALLVLAQQLAIGFAIGTVLQLAFNALVFGGQMVAYSMGLGFAHLMDPQNGVQVPTVSQFYLVFATIIFLGVDGHLRLVALLVESFEALPVSAEGIGRAELWDVAGWGAMLFADGLLLSLPIVSALLLVNIGMGMVSRAAPQLNIFSVGFPVTLGLGFVLLWLTLPQALRLFTDWVEVLFGLAGGLIAGA